jgi:hypothetical protein
MRINAQIEEMCNVVEMFLMIKKNVSIKIVFDNKDKEEHHIQLLHQAYDVAVNFFTFGR